MFVHQDSKCLPACLRFKFIIPVYVGHCLCYAQASTNVNFLDVYNSNNSICYN